WSFVVGASLVISGSLVIGGSFSFVVFNGRGAGAAGGRAAAAHAGGHQVALVEIRAVLAFALASAFAETGVLVDHLPGLDLVAEDRFRIQDHVVAFRQTILDFDDSLIGQHDPDVAQTRAD